MPYTHDPMNQAVSLMARNLSVAACTLLALAGCASVPHERARLSKALVGQHKDVLVQRYGHPLVIDRTLIFDKTGTATYPTTDTSRFHGTLSDGRTVSGTVSSPGEPLTVPMGCTLRATVDSSGVVEAIAVSGDVHCLKSFGA